jgi:hypothetical protein
MDQIPQRLIFNSRPPDQKPRAQEKGGHSGPALAIPGEDPPVELQLDVAGVPDAARRDSGAARVAKQIRRLGALRPTALDPDPFGQALDWDYRCYHVVRQEAGSSQADEWPFRTHLYLFNILVALEWNPSDQQIERLRWTFRRASDFLFDVTDGWMAIGQVVLGGPELMAAADIQIMASTRLHPRSWVGAMHAHEEYQRDEKFMPVRLGRGLWNDARRYAMPWEEPEGYRIIVHEWGHYALKLTDEYLETRQVLLPAGITPPNASAQSLMRPAPVTVVLLKVATTTDSIMATTEGTSELLSDQWPKLREPYPRISPTRPDKAVRAGPNRLPLPLPRFRHIQQDDAKRIGSAAVQQYFPKWDSGLNAVLTRLGLPDKIRLDRCWVYVLKGISEQQPYPERLIAQGTLEDRSAVAPFALLGAEAGDTVVLIGEERDHAPVVLSARLTNGERLRWHDATPPVFPTIDVIPAEVEPNAPRAQVRVRLMYHGEGAEPPAQVCIFPLGQMPDQLGILLPGAYGLGWSSEPHDLPTLDGHVLLRWNDGRMAISSFSQGGDGPNSGFPFPANPMNAGSADGSALLFLYKDRPDDRPPNDIKMVTAIARGLPHGNASWRDRSATFGIAGNQPLPRTFNPTLMLYYDVFGEDQQPALGEGDLLICRWMGDQGWKPLPTYLPSGFRFAVAPLDDSAGGALIAASASGPRVEYYKVCWVPRE